MDLRTKLVLALVAASLLSMLALGSMAYAMADERLTQRAARQLGSLAEAKSEDLQNVVEGWKDRVALVAGRTQLRSSLHAYNATGASRHRVEILRILQDAQRATETLASITVYDRGGEPVAWTGRGPGAGRPARLDTSAVNGAPDTVHFQGISFDDTQPESVRFVAPLELDGRSIGALRAFLDPRDLIDLIGDTTDLGRTGEILLAIPDTGDVVRVLEPGRGTGSPGVRIHTNGMDDPIQRALRGQRGPFTEGLRDHSGESVWAASRLLSELGWAVVVKFDEEEEREAVGEFGDQLVMVGFALSAFAILFGVLLGMRFAKPVQELAAMADRIRAGDLGARVEHGSREDELGLLAATFNQTAAALEEQMGLLREYEKFFDLSPDMLCIADAEGYFRRVNPAFERVLGWSEEELLSRPFVEFVHPDDVERTHRETARLASGTPTVSFENRYRRPDGSYRRLRWTCHPDPDSGLLYAVARPLE